MENFWRCFEQAPRREKQSDLTGWSLSDNFNLNWLVDLWLMIFHQSNPGRSPSTDCKWHLPKTALKIKVSKGKNSLRNWVTLLRNETEIWFLTLSVFQVRCYPVQEAALRVRPAQGSQIWNQNHLAYPTIFPMPKSHPCLLAGEPEDSVQGELQVRGAGEVSGQPGGHHAAAGWGILEVIGNLQ